MGSKFRCALTQLTSVDALRPNLDTILRVYTAAASQGDVDLVVFPENALFFRLHAGQTIEVPEPSMWAELEAHVSAAGVPLMLTTPIQEGSFVNATLLFRPGQPKEVVYRKIHMFDVDIPGAPPVRESDVFAAGTAPAVVDINGWKIGLTICYDLRFAELFLTYARQAVDLILVPSAFLVPTGRAHWEILLRARAIETQAFVIAPAQSGRHVSAADGSARETWGHALGIGPWGEVLNEFDGETAFTIIDLERERLTRVRAQMPVTAHRRLGRAEGGAVSF